MNNQRENPISVRSKKWLTDALFELMKEKPYEKISIREIAEKAGLTRQTFYHNFSSKEMLLMYKSDQLFDEFYHIARKNNIKTAEELILFYFRYWKERSEFIKLLIDNNVEHILTHRYPEYFKIVSILDVEGTLTEAQQEYVYVFYSGSLIYLLCKWVERGMDCSPKEMTRIVKGILDGEFFLDERKEI